MFLMISSEGQTLESSPSLRFGRSPFFIKYDLESETWEAFENDAVYESGGAGVAAAQFLIDKNIATALSGRFGPNAERVLSAAGIELLTFDQTYSSILEVIEGQKNNKLTSVNPSGVN